MKILPNDVVLDMTFNPGHAQADNVSDVAAELIHLRHVIEVSLKLIDSGRCAHGREVLKTGVLPKDEEL